MLADIALIGITSLVSVNNAATADSVAPAASAVYESVMSMPADSTYELPAMTFMPAIYRTFDPRLSRDNRFSSEPDSTAVEWPWLHSQVMRRRISRGAMQRYFITYPDRVKYNVNTLPEPPKQYVVSSDPNTALFIFSEVIKPADQIGGTIGIVESEIQRHNWINQLGVNIQFSQAFLSPNWYQGGNNSLNMIADFVYDTKLNTQFHPNLLFENNFQWRTALSSTPDDPYRKYGLTENRFQINSKFGYKAAHNWYYTFTGVFKTPIFRGYKSGTETPTASFLSPGELNIGIGMTYNFTNPKKTFSIGVTLSPLSYNLKTVIDKDIDETSHGLEPGHKTLSSYGSSGEINMDWTICYNVQWKSRVFAFTDYQYYQYDWQNQFIFTINRWLSANLNVDLHYDSKVEPINKWGKVQLREILSLGFTYKFNH